MTRTKEKTSEEDLVKISISNIKIQLQELLALGEQIGNVNTGLPEETIRRYMKTRIYLLPATTINLEEEPCVDHESEVCIICQVIVVM